MTLTETERKILIQLCTGNRLHKIAEKLERSVSTVGTHLHRACVKLGAKTPEHACVIFDRLERAEAPKGAAFSAATGGPLHP